MVNSPSKGKIFFTWKISHQRIQKKKPTIKTAELHLGWIFQLQPGDDGMRTFMVRNINETFHSCFFMLDRPVRTEKAFMKAFMVQWGKPSTSNGLEMIRAIMSAQKKVPYMWGFNILAPESDQLNSLVNQKSSYNRHPS